MSLPTKIPAKLRKLLNPVSPPVTEKVSVRVVAVEVDAADEATTKVMTVAEIAVVDAAVEVAVVEAAGAAETMAADDTTVVDVEAIDLVEFAASHPVRKLWKAQSKAFSNFTPNSTASCGTPRKTTSLRNPTRSYQAHLSRKPAFAKA